MAHSHQSDSGRTFKIGLVLNTSFTVFELVAGTVTGSLALIADGTHNLTDSLTLLIAYIADRISKRQADDRRSYGYGRARIIASLLNAGILVAIAIFIGIEALQRLSQPAEVPGLVVAAVAGVGIIINGLVAYMLSKQKHDLNAKTAYLNMLYDMFSSVGALLAGFAIFLFGWTWLDSVVGIMIALMLLYATFGIIKETLHILLEGVPKGIDAQEVRQTLLNVTHVKDVDDLHIWSISSNDIALSCHIVIDDRSVSDSIKVVSQLKQLLKEKYHITHTTIETQLKAGPHDNERIDEGL